jgi:hypothetical protein
MPENQEFAVHAKLCNGSNLVETPALHRRYVRAGNRKTAGLFTLDRMVTLPGARQRRGIQTLESPPYLDGQYPQLCIDVAHLVQYRLTHSKQFHVHTPSAQAGTLRRRNGGAFVSMRSKCDK